MLNMSSVFYMFKDRQTAVDEEPYSQLEWSEDESSDSDKASTPDKEAKKKDADEDADEGIVPIMQTNAAVEKSQQQQLAMNKAKSPSITKVQDLMSKSNPLIGQKSD